MIHHDMAIDIFFVMTENHYLLPSSPQSCNEFQKATDDPVGAYHLWRLNLIPPLVMVSGLMLHEVIGSPESLNLIRRALASI